MLLFQNDCFRFPTDAHRRERWAVRIRRLDPDTGKLWMPGSRDVICSEHFTSSDFYYQWSRKLIKPSAEPTIFTFCKPTVHRKPPVDRCVARQNAVAASDNSNVVENMDVDTSDVANTSSYEEVHSSVFADHQYSVKSPKKLTKQVETLTQRLCAKTRALRSARRREQRLQGKVSDLLQKIKNMNLLTNQAEELLETYQNIPLKLLSGKRRSKFSEDQKQFAITLHYYSHSAYKFIRKRFKLLPCSRTIRGWLSAYDGTPGITEQSFSTITANLNTTCKTQWMYKLCALHIDEMEIKKQIDVDRHSGKVYGFTDLGVGI